jgi:hypothetical protein
MLHGLPALSRIRAINHESPPKTGPTAHLYTPHGPARGTLLHILNRPRTAREGHALRLPAASAPAPSRGGPSGQLPARPPSLVRFRAFLPLPPLRPSVSGPRAGRRDLVRPLRSGPRPARHYLGARRGATEERAMARRIVCAWCGKRPRECPYFELPRCEMVVEDDGEGSTTHQSPAGVGPCRALRCATVDRLQQTSSTQHVR